MAAAALRRGRPAPVGRVLPLPLSRELRMRSVVPSEKPTEPEPEAWASHWGGMAASWPAASGG